MTEYGMLVGTVAATVLQCRRQVLREVEERRPRLLRVVAVLGLLLAAAALRAGQLLLAVAGWMSMHALDD